jgi:LysM repeat protein
MKYIRVVLAVAFLLTLVGAAPAAAASPTVESSPAPAMAACGATYTIVFGDTLAKIAARCGTTVSALLAANPAIRNANRIFVGQRITIPGGQPGPVTNGQFYVVRAGDTLAKIAARFGVTVQAIMHANSFIQNPNRIFAGERIFIPSTSSGGTTTSVKVALIAIGGGTIGCNDGVVLVTRSIAPTTAPLTAAIAQLLSIKTQHYGMSGLYDALYASNLHISSVTIVNGKATIRLTGNLSLGGECDDPRVQAQFDSTARQFSTVHTVEVFINGVLLQTLLSGRG